jgi:hypothetical protein
MIVGARANVASMKIPNTNKTMTEQDIEEALLTLAFHTGVGTDEFFNELQSGLTYDAANMLTRDHGVVFRMKDGSEFQITIVRSK